MVGSVTKPTLLLDEERVRNHVQRMVDKARRWNISFRPHFNTHQSLEIGRWFREAGVGQVTVSSVSMARFFADDGWNDITVAFPVNLREVYEIDDLASRIRLSVLVEDASVLKKLDDALTREVGVWIEVDTGYHRTGLDPDDHASF